MNALQNINETIPDAKYLVNYRQVHRIIAHLKHGERFFSQKYYGLEGVIMHVPLPLRAVLVHSLYTFDSNSPVSIFDGEVHIFGILTAPGYENKIIISHAETAVYTDSPKVIIDDLTGFPRYTELYLK